MDYLLESYDLVAMMLLTNWALSLSTKELNSYLTPDSCSNLCYVL